MSATRFESNGRADADDGLEGLVVHVTPWTLHMWTPDEALHWVVDRAGRLVAGHAQGDHLRVGLDATVVLRGSGRDAPARRCEQTEGDLLLADVAWVLRRAAARLARFEAELRVDGGAPEQARAGLAGQTPSRPPDGPSSREAGERLRRTHHTDGADDERADVVRLLERAAERAARPDLERAAFARVYRPVRVLPPDCAQSLVLQLTEGCSHGRCTFCSLYADVPFRVKSTADFAEHAEAVAGLLGESLTLRTRVFLGDANALLAPMPALLDALRTVKARFPEASRRGVHTFVDAFSGRGRSVAELRALRDLGLRRITVGLESGHLPLLAWMRKPSTPEAVSALVQRAKAAGLEVGVTVLVGAGGRTLADAHVDDTGRVVRGLGLGSGDLVFLSPLVIAPDGEYARRAAHAGMEPLDPVELRGQATRLADAVAGGRWRVTTYDLQRWVY